MTANDPRKPGAAAGGTAPNNSSPKLELPPEPAKVATDAIERMLRTADRVEQRSHPGLWIAEWIRDSAATMRDTIAAIFADAIEIRCPGMVLPTFDVDGGAQ